MKTENDARMIDQECKDEGCHQGCKDLMDEVGVVLRC